MKPSERILEVSHKDDIHFFDIESFMECQFKNNSLLIKNTKHEDVEIVPTQIRKYDYRWNNHKIIYLK